MGCSKPGDAIDQNMSVDENLKFNKDTILRLRGSKDCAGRAYVEMCTIINSIKRADLPPDEAATAIRVAGDELVCLDRPYRWACLKALLETYAETPSIFWPLFITWWPDNESRSGWSATVARALSFGSAQKYMRPEDRECFTALPDPVSIYRGQLAGRHAGIAWTTDRERAEWFARRSALFKKISPVHRSPPGRPSLAFAAGGIDLPTYRKCLPIRRLLLADRFCRRAGVDVVPIKSAFLALRRCPVRGSYSGQ